MKRFYVSKNADSSAKWWIYDQHAAQCGEPVIGFRLKREAQAQADEWNREEQDTHQVKILYVGMREFRGSIGIHLKNPMGSEISEALHQANRDLFERIYCHYDNVSSLDLKRESKQEQVS